MPGETVADSEIVVSNDVAAVSLTLLFGSDYNSRLAPRCAGCVRDPHAVEKKRELEG